MGEPEIMVLEPSDIASMSAQTVEVYLHGPKPRIIERLVIEPAQAAAEAVSDHIRPLGRPIQACALDPEDLRKQFFAANEEGRVVMDWKCCRPALGVFLQQVSRECPSVVIAPKERSELDLNGIWHGISLNLDAQKRKLLVQAHRLGFDCVWLLCRYKYISRRKAAAYLAEIAREEAEPECSAVQQ